MIDESSWQWPEVFNWLQTAGNVERHELITVSQDYCPACSGSGQSPRPTQCQR
ncbi:hypothetical protein ACLB1S_22560 [Escherichia coli]